jgi:hypothetical protein
MASKREYELTQEAILHLVAAMPVRLFTHGDASHVWRTEGCRGLATWTLFVAVMTPDITIAESEDLAALYELCNALNTMITEDTSK